MLSADWTFDEDIKASIKLENLTKELKSIHVKTKDKDIEIPVSEFKDLHTPDISRITFVKIVTLPNDPKKWSITFNYFETFYSWGTASSEVTFYFSDSEN